MAMEFPDRLKPWRRTLRNLVVVAILVIIAIKIGLTIYYGEKDPVVNILDNEIQIESRYFGLNVDLSEITGISLVERSMRDIGGGGLRTGGYGADSFGGSVKGGFQSTRVGDVLLFVHSRSSPTIWIERELKRDIYISFRDGDRTGALYNEMKAAIRR